MGQVGFLIEGPAGRGKDQLVAAVLEQRGWPKEKTTFFNASSDIDAFSDAVKKAAKDGHRLVISEMNLLPSDILESELNNLLTGDTDVHADFCLIATVNPPTYSGRKPLSPAILNRMVVNRMDEYPLNECIEIARGIAETLKQTLPRDHIQPLQANEDMITELATAHHALVMAATEQGLATPTTRQLRKAVEALVLEPRPSNELLETYYRYYQEDLQSVAAHPSVTKLKTRPHRNVPNKTRSSRH